MHSPLLCIFAALSVATHLSWDATKTVIVSSDQFSAGDRFKGFCLMLSRPEREFLHSHELENAVVGLASGYECKIFKTIGMHFKSVCMLIELKVVNYI